VSSYESTSRPPLVLPGRSRRRPPARLAPFAVAAGACALVVATNLVDFGADHGHARLFDASAEWSWSHILATVAFGVGALAGALGARSAVPPRRAWRATGALFGVLFLDNVTRLHTHIGHWPAFYAPLLLGLSVALLAAARDTRESLVVVAGLATLLASLGIHVVGPHVVHALGWGTDSWAYQVKVGLKEGTELAGWVLVVPGLWRLLSSSRASRAARYSRASA
jgi:hypothetical protein